MQQIPVGLKFKAINELQLVGGGFNDRRDVVLVRKEQPDGTSKWAVQERSFVLSKSGEWEYELLPSSRTDKFIARTRFDSMEEAVETFDRVEAEGEN